MSDLFTCSSTDSGGSYGWVAGVVIAVLVVIVILGFIAWKIYHKKFRQAGTSGEFISLQKT